MAEYSSTFQLISNLTETMPNPSYQNSSTPLHWGEVPHQRGYLPVLRHFQALPE